jgi:hypothetical protein
MREQIEQALAAWRDAVRRLDGSQDGEREALIAEVEEHRQRFQQLSADYMTDRIDALKEAERRRKAEMPSSPAFHQAAEEELEIAADIWGTTLQSAVETPHTSPNETDDRDRGSP